MYPKNGEKQEVRQRKKGTSGRRYPKYSNSRQLRSGQGATIGTFSTELNKTVNGADNSADIADGTPGQKGGAQLQ
jgi:hypothetical protein